VTVPSRLVDRSSQVSPRAPIDEFELDDPGDTVLVSTLLGRLAERADMLSGGYRKKYRRAISRLVALNRTDVGVG
jgi:hypothetical protein